MVNLKLLVISLGLLVQISLDRTWETWRIVSLPGSSVFYYSYAKWPILPLVEHLGYS